MFKILFSLLFMLSCQAQYNKESAKAASTEGTSLAGGMASDTLIAPEYGADGQLLRLELSDADWKKRLSAREYEILREKGTERAFTGDLLKNKGKGIYTCAGCALPLFASTTKFDSGTGWPSYFAPYKPGLVAEESDTAYGMVRTEVLCGRCGGHLGHVFNDGPAPTGLRYCINAVSLNFVAEK